MYIYIYICTHICVYIYIHTHIYSYISISISISLSLSLYIHIYIYIYRLDSLHDALSREVERAEAGRKGEPSEAVVLEHGDREGVVLELRDFTLRTPLRLGAPQQTLVDGLSFCLRDSMSMLVAGSSGIGKSSLLRSIAGLWTEGRGRVLCCRRDAIFFMPQRPYMFLGTLREQMLYPDLESDATDDTLAALLQEVNLGYLLKRYSLDDAETWTNVLSLGEQQRINFVRVLLRSDLQLALIDEGTSACDPANEQHLYKLLGERLRSYVSVGHRPPPPQFKCKRQ